MPIISWSKLISSSVLLIISLTLAAIAAYVLQNICYPQRQF